MKKRKREDNGDNTGEGEPQKILKSTENSAKNDDKGQTAAEFVKSVKTSLSSPQTVVSGRAVSPCRANFRLENVIGSKRFVFSLLCCFQVLQS